MPIGELWRLLRGLSPERRAVIEKEYAKARETVGDAEASAIVLAMLTDAEKSPASSTTPRKRPKSGGGLK